MEKVNIANLLRDCPSGMELDCTMYDNAYFEKVDEKAAYPIVIRIGKTDTICLTKEGHWNKFPNAKCIIFPKGKTTWEGFQRPFIEGDILATNDGKFIAIIKKNGGKYYCCCHTNGNYFITDYSGWFDRFATEEEKQTLFQVIKNNGYHWNEETKVLKKLPIFKIGDRIKLENSKFTYTITDLLEDRYRATIDSRDLYEITFERQDAYKLIPDKFDINTLTTFDKVLVRDFDDETWEINFFSRLLDNKHFKCLDLSYVQCIPYEGNEYLRGTTNSCDDYFKTWKDE